MVYLQFPSELTAEELMLQANYAKLKKKKKALQDFKTRNSEHVVKPKCPSDARNAREAAQKLIKSGVIAPIKTQKRPEESFKKSRCLERKLISTDNTVSSYQPFSKIESAQEEPEVKRPNVKKLSDSFVPSTDPADKVFEKPVSKPNAKPVKGNTIFVYGYKLSEEYLKEHFATFGKIVQIKMKNEKTSFVTFEKPESAEEAIIQMDGMKIESIELQVAMARNQFPLDQQNENSASSMWVSIASSFNSQKGIHRDKRDLKTYDDNLFE